MARVRRANVILSINDDQVERFVDQGYDVIDNKGNVITKSIPQDVGALQKAYMDHVKEITELKEYNRVLEGTVKDLEAYLAELKGQAEKKSNKKKSE